MAIWASVCQLLFHSHLSLSQAEQASFFPCIIITLEVEDTVRGDGLVPSALPVFLRVFRMPPHSCFSPGRFHKQGPLGFNLLWVSAPSRRSNQTTEQSVQP